MPTAPADRLACPLRTASCAQLARRITRLSPRLCTSPPPMTSTFLSEVFIVKISARARRAARAAADRQPRRLDAQRDPGALRRPDRRRPRPASSCARPTWRSACASRSQAEVAREGTVVLPARLLARRRPLAARRRPCRSSCAPPSRTSSSSAGNATFHIRTLRGEDFPPLPEPERRRRGRRVPAAGVRRRRSLEGRQLRLARRDAPGPHRHPRVGVRSASCGWSRPTPTA